MPNNKEFIILANLFGSTAIKKEIIIQLIEETPINPPPNRE